MVAVIKVSHSAEASSALRQHSSEITGVLRKGAMGFSIHCHLSDFSRRYKPSSDNKFLPYLECYSVCQLQKEKDME